MTWPAEQAHAQPGRLAERNISASAPAGYYQPIALVDVLDRVLAGGVVIAGEVTLSIAGVDLVVVSLRALVASAAALAGAPDELREVVHERA